MMKHSIWPSLLLRFMLCVMVIQPPRTGADSGWDGTSTTSSATVAPGTAGATPAPAPTIKGGVIDMYAPATQKFVDTVLEFANACTDDEQSRLFGGYTNNRPIYDKCVQASGYVFFPNKGVLPNQVQIEHMSESEDCMKLMTGIAKSFLPECTIYNFSGRSGAEVTLRIRHQVLVEKKPLPTPQQYHWQYRFNQAVNLLLENDQVRQKIYSLYSDPENAAFPLDRLVKARSPVYIYQGITVAKDLTISETQGASSTSGSGSYDATIAKRAGKSDGITNPNANAFSTSKASGSSWSRMIFLGLLGIGGAGLGW